MTDNAKRDFDTAAQTWDENPARIAMASAIADAMIARVPPRPDADVLDYGAGTGLVTLRLQPHVRSIVAADSSQGMLDKLTEKVRASGMRNVAAVLLDLERDPPLDQRFDLIVSSMTFHHIADVAALVRALRGMLKPKGWLAVADLDLDGGEFHSDPTGVKHDGLDREEMKRAFEDSGLSDVSIETAYTITRDVPGRGSREFSVFLIIGRALN